MQRWLGLCCWLWHQAGSGGSCYHFCSGSPMLGLPAGWCPVRSLLLPAPHIPSGCRTAGAQEGWGSTILLLPLVPDLVWHCPAWLLWPGSEDPNSCSYLVPGAAAALTLYWSSYREGVGALGNHFCFWCCSVPWGHCMHCSDASIKSLDV